MPNVLRIARKEIGAYFSSLAALMFIGVFLAACLFAFFWVETFFARNVADVRPLFEWMPLLLIFLISAITMRMWSEERRSGTLEFLMTTPARPAELIFGKFLACLALVGVALALTLPLPFTVAALGPLDWGPVVGGYFATLCVAAAYIAIGLFVSARTDSQIVSLIVTALVCGAFYVVGSPAVTSLVGNAGGEALRLLGAGSRFQSIARGVLDLRDVYYYLSVFGAFTVLNVFSLERLRWSDARKSDRHFRWRAFAGLAVANLIAANFWLHHADRARIDLTEGRIYSISQATRGYLARLEEPLLIRGYFSAETHPELAPLAPRLQDLMREYDIAGGDAVRVEIVDPIEEPALEEEAGRRFGIRPVPFQTASRYQSSVTNSYFDVVVQYGDEFETLSYADLIEIKQAGASLEVELKNPEYDITRAIKKVVTSYRAAGDLWASLDAPVTLRAYASDPAELPEPLPQLRDDLEALVGEYELEAGDKFSAEIADPTAGDGALAERLQSDYGLQPLAVGLFDPARFWFHLVLEHKGRLIQVPLPETLDKDALKRAIDAELKRFSPGALRTIALNAPSAPPPSQFGPPPTGLRFEGLRVQLEQNADVRDATFEGGRAPAQSDALIVVGPERLSDVDVFAIDQFLMRGGTVVLAASRFRPQLQNDLSIAENETGLEDWLGHYGVTLEPSLVLDPQNTPFPVPVTRDVGGFQVREFRLLPYTHFVDVRDGLAEGDAPTAGLGQLTLTWASPIAVDEEKLGALKATTLVESSEASWASADRTIVPDLDRFPEYGYPIPDETGRQTLGLMLEGSFGSFFAGKDNPVLAAAAEEAAADEEAADAAGEDEAAEAEPPAIGGIIERSPQSARLVVFGSSSFLSDEALGLAAGVDRADYAAPLVLMENVVDWSLEDRALLEIRSRQGRFSRSLAAVDEAGRAFWETANYVLALLGLVAVFFVHRILRRRADARRLVSLGPAPAAAE